MASIPEFLAVTTVAAGSGTAHDSLLAIAALDEFLGSVQRDDERSALAAASQAFENLCLNGAVAESVRAHIDGRLSQTTSANLRVVGGSNAL